MKLGSWHLIRFSFEKIWGEDRSSFLHDNGFLSAVPMAVGDVALWTDGALGIVVALEELNCGCTSCVVWKSGVSQEEIDTPE